MKNLDINTFIDLSQLIGKMNTADKIEFKILSNKFNDLMLLVPLDKQKYYLNKYLELYNKLFNK